MAGQGSPAVPHLLADWQQVEVAVAALPIPVLAVDARAIGWPVRFANRSFTAGVGSDTSPVGRPLRDVLDVDLTDALEAVRATGHGVRDFIAVLDELPPGPRVGSWGTHPPRVHWSIDLEPLRDADGIAAIQISAVDITGEVVAHSRIAETSALRELAEGLTADTPVDQLHVDAVRGAAHAAGGRRGVLLLSDGSSAFEVAAATPGAGVEGPVEIVDLASPIWQVALRRTRLEWSSTTGEPPPLPFAGSPGWEELLVVGLRVRGREQGILVVGEPRLGTFDTGALEQLELAVALASTALDNARFLDDRDHLSRLLAGAVDTSAALVEATDPAAVRLRLLTGIVRDMGFEGAALWEPGEAGLELVDAVGLPSDAVDRVRILAPHTVAARLARSHRSSRIDPAAAASATSSWGGHRVRLVPVPEPARGVLGVYAHGVVPELVDEVLATLGHALAAAINQITLHRRAEQIVDSMQRELRPRDTAPSTALDFGSVYQSATAGAPVGGDFYDVFGLDGDKVGVACGDVSGKGVEAASLSAMAVHSLRAFALNASSPHIVATLLNTTVAKQTGSERFMALAYATVDGADGSVELVLSGHPPPVVVGPDGARVWDIEADLPLGIDTAATFRSHRLVLQPGESLVLCTDGVTEARPDDDQVSLFGLERLSEVVAEHAGHASAQELAEAVWSAVQDWTGGRTTDDCAIVILRRSPDAPQVGAGTMPPLAGTIVAEPIQ